MGSLLMRRLQYVLRRRIVSGNQRPRTQVVAEVRDPESAHGEGEREVCQSNGEGLGKAGLDVPEQVDVARDEHPGGQPNQAGDVALERAGQQKEKRDEEMKDNQKQTNELPSPVQTTEVPGNLFRQVTRPDDEPLRKGEIGPHHNEREQEVAVIVHKTG